MVIAVHLLPDHTQLPESDGAIVENFQEHPQSILLTDSILPMVRQLHPDGNFAIGQDSGIYWNFTEEPLKGCVAPDWFYVPGVPPILDGKFRRSYVMWQEQVIPLIAIEFVSGNGQEEKDNTPATKTSKGGKFWVYEQGIKIPYYAIYEVSKASVEVYCLITDRYQKMMPNDRGHFCIPEMNVELGIWQGFYCTMSLPWLRWWDRDGNLLLTGEERALVALQIAELERQQNQILRQQAESEHQQNEILRQQAELEREQNEILRQQAESEREQSEILRQKAESEHQRAEKLAAQLRSIGIDPDIL